MGRASTRDLFAYVALSDPQPCRTTPCMTTKVHIQSRTLTRAGAGGLLQVCHPWSTAVPFSEALMSLWSLPQQCCCQASSCTLLSFWLVTYRRPLLCASSCSQPGYQSSQSSVCRPSPRACPPCLLILKAQIQGFLLVTLKFSVGSLPGQSLLHHCHCSSTSEEQALPEVGVPSSAIIAGVHLPGLQPSALGCVTPLSEVLADTKLTYSLKKPECVHIPVTDFLLMLVVYLTKA